MKEDEARLRRELTRMEEDDKKRKTKLVTETRKQVTEAFTHAHSHAHAYVDLWRQALARKTLGGSGNIAI